MSALKHLIEEDGYSEVHPIDLVELLARQSDWLVSRTEEDQISLVAHGVWRTYQLSLEYRPKEQVLYVACSFEMNLPSARRAALFELLNMINARCWCGCFVFAGEQNMMAYRYGLVLAGASSAADQLDQVMQGAFGAAERYYPAFQLVCWGDETPREAMRMVFDNPKGRA